MTLSSELIKVRINSSAWFVVGLFGNHFTTIQQATMSKETAVEYMFRLLDVMTFNKDDESQDIFEAIFERAKAMEKEQIIEAFCEGYDHDGDNYDGAEISYYNRTYKGGEQ